MISITTVQCETDILAIIALQQANLKQNVPIEVQASDGFVTVEHRHNVLQRMNQIMPRIIAKDATSKIIGYALSMPSEFGTAVPELHSLFSIINSLEYKEKPLKDYAYYVMGQSCVAIGFRGQKILTRMLNKHREIYSDRFRLIITSISDKNPRSLHAHISGGFASINSFYDEMTNEIWHILVWDWRKDISS
ncbi:unnamed protein product [Rotaria magnacalcarata]|uniref:GNAT family N-acetyltransferase n=2 Tax=Rotaria magnacalcarata TaxID=392030 RepID=A0A815BYZ8_9BILA|nr:unnamed protein product [Rotaria magnacalcarata]